MRFHLYLKRAFSLVGITDYVPATLKTMVFGFIIATISAYLGFTTESGTEGVGRASTRAVVLSSVAVGDDDRHCGIRTPVDPIPGGAPEHGDLVAFYRDLLEPCSVGGFDSHHPQCREVRGYKRLHNAPRLVGAAI